MDEQVTVSAYCRISTKSDDQLNSLANQQSFFYDYVESKKNYQLFHTYYDTLSGTTYKKREQFMQMLYDAGLDHEIRKGQLNVYLSDRAPKFSRILVKDVSRFARNITSIEILRKLRDKEVFIDFVNMNLSTQNMSEDMMVGMFMLFAERESKDRSEKVIFGNKQSAIAGKIRTADIFYGFKYVKETNDLIIIEEEAEVIRKVYDLYIEGNGFRKIIQYLEINGIHTRAGKPFVQQSVKRMLENHAYKGWLVRNKMDSPLVFSGKKYATYKDEKEWKIHKGKIPAIVTEEIFDKVQDIKNSKVDYLTKKGIHSAKSEYANLIKCNKCGSSYTRNIETKNGHVFYNCTTKKQKGVKVCNNPNIKLAVLQKAMDSLNDKDFSKMYDKQKATLIGVIEGILKKNLLNKIDKHSSEEVATKQFELDELNIQKNRLGDLYLIGQYDKEYLETKTIEFGIKADELIKDIKNLSRTNEDIFNDINELDDIIIAINKLKSPNVDSLEDIKNSIKIIVQEHPKNPKIAVAAIYFPFLDDIGNVQKKYPILNNIKVFQPIW